MSCTPEHIETLGQGWFAGEALAISLFCILHYENDIRNGLLAAVNHGGDSDSTGSITGNILGLINGDDAIPSGWISRLRFSDIVLEIAQDFVIAANNAHEPDFDWADKYPGY